MTLALIRIPRKTIFLDDVGSFLEALQITQDEDAEAQYHSSPRGAISVMQRETANWGAARALLYSALADAKEKGIGYAPILAAGYFNDWRRFELSSLLVIDYMMPGMNGLETLKEIPNWPGRRLLLTGAADSQIAIEAFNAGLIQAFLPKQSPQLLTDLKDMSEKMHASLCAEIGQLMIPHFSRKQMTMLSTARIQNALECEIELLGWREYVAVANPFGLLGAAPKGPLQWLQIETKETLEEMADLAGEYGYSGAERGDMLEGDAMTMMEIETQFGKPHSGALVPAKRLLGTLELVVAAISLDTPILQNNWQGFDGGETQQQTVTKLLCRAAVLRKVIAQNNSAEHPQHAQIESVNASISSSGQALIDQAAEIMVNDKIDVAQVIDDAQGAMMPKNIREVLRSAMVAIRSRSAKNQLQ